MARKQLFICPDCKKKYRVPAARAATSRCKKCKVALVPLHKKAASENRAEAETIVGPASGPQESPDLDATLDPSDLAQPPAPDLDATLDPSDLAQPPASDLDATLDPSDLAQPPAADLDATLDPSDFAQSPSADADDMDDDHHIADTDAIPVSRKELHDDGVEDVEAVTVDLLRSDDPETREFLRKHAKQQEADLDATLDPGDLAPTAQEERKAQDPGEAATLDLVRESGSKAKADPNTRTADLHRPGRGTSAHAEKTHFRQTEPPSGVRLESETLLDEVPSDFREVMAGDQASNTGQGADLDETYIPDDMQSPMPGSELQAETVTGEDSDRGIEQSIDSLWGETVHDDADVGMTLKQDGGQLKLRNKDERTICQVTVKPRYLDEPEQLNPQTDFELIKVLGEGGMGVVYSARQTAIDRSVALKMIKGEAALNPASREKFLAEAAITGELEHPNIIPVHDLGTTPDGKLFYAMKQVKGQPWDDVIGEKSLRENLGILMRVCDAIAFAHSREVIHRDLKPENVMLGEFGEVVVMDWGLAASLHEEGKAESIMKSAIGGTPAYMSPEMAGGENELIGKESDVYLLGGILYEIVTGLRPHTGGNVMECLYNACANEIQPSDVDGELIEIALKAMEMMPVDRYRSASEMKGALGGYLDHSESLNLSDAALSHLETAQDSGNYEDYARALFGYEEALRLWDENDDAAEGVIDTRLAYAQTALDKGDLDLAQSLLPAKIAAYKALSKEVQAAQQKKRARQRNFRIMVGSSVALVVIIFAVVTVGFFLVSAEQSKTAQALAQEEIAKADAEAKRVEAEAAKADAEKKKEKAEAAEKYAKEQEKVAKDQRDEAERQKAIAQKARDKAKAEELRANTALEDMLAAQKNLAEAKTSEERARAQEELAKVAAKSYQETIEAQNRLRQNTWWTFGAEKAKAQQQEAATKFNMPIEQVIQLPKGRSFGMVLIPPGTFGMGSPAREPYRSGEEYLHQVKITKPYYMAKTEFTLADWIALAGREPAEYTKKVVRTEGAPVVLVNWFDIQEKLLPKLQAHAPKGYRFRLPTEAQWEYAARAGTNTPFFTGDDPDALALAGWYAKNSEQHLHPVAQKQANAWGLYDMHGNVTELCRDPYSIDAYPRTPDTVAIDPLYAGAEEHRVARGGSWINTWHHCRSAYRSEAHPANRYELLGFRLVLEREE